MPGWSGGETKRFREPQGLKPLVVLHSVLEISDFAFSVGGQFLCLLRIKGKRVFLHALVSVLDEERTIYCILGVAKAYARGACWQTIRVVPFTDYGKKASSASKVRR